MAQALVLVAHPQLEVSRVTRQLMQRAARLGERVEVRDLYALYPDYWIDVAAERAALAEPRLIVWLQPIHWYGMTPLLRLWLDEVLGFGWAYGPGGRALHGKDLWLVASTGGPQASYHPTGYNRFFFDAFLPPYEQTAALCGLRWLPPLLLHGAHRADEATLAAHEQVFADRLQTHPDWPEMAALTAADGCDVPADARPEAG
ncbi:MAG: NAD(P)H-dependent oxidoreductase [Rubrivivax sp.]|nr:NAD(P)H-dependent oxidoreductase [Rubrivivax sp.]MDH5339957.1 NAD(P)H-dependent oxidoreductase [Rubrivivax sp.]